MCAISNSIISPEILLPDNNFNRFSFDTKAIVKTLSINSIFLKLDMVYSGTFEKIEMFINFDKFFFACFV